MCAWETCFIVHYRHAYAETRAYFSFISPVILSCKIPPPCTIPAQPLYDWNLAMVWSNFSSICIITTGAACW